MPTKFSEAFKINPITLDELGVFDAILDVDTRVFFDPALINLTSAPEFQDAKMKIEKYCSDIITLLSHSRMRPTQGLPFVRRISPREPCSGPQL